MDFRVASTVGVHPKVVVEFGGEERLTLESLWNSGYLAGYGEIGLDRTVSPSYWLAQEELVKDLLSRVPAKGVIVLHARGMAHDSFNEEPCMRLLGLCSAAGLSHHRRIQLHCWQGSRLMAMSWLDRFPNTYFSINNGVQHFSQDQRAGLKCLPPSRLLLESDGPAFSPPGFRANGPHLLGVTARLVARVLGTTPECLIARTTSNAEELFFGSE
ncbi:3'-5' ssDNA/RNA exonuclease TatD-like [Mercenaria mercenaria]|uniref:3'-5' ssDNA/RNA exonuclease TatD-like n=1 Tax=Mercenaria mercenaria TaxID=6596 RepID=UPI00234EA13A|nr:3'-5' ssDNA/RNA exonuclease TatD-like [Mercenaria mercenaria]